MTPLYPQRLRRTLKHIRHGEHFSSETFRQKSKPRNPAQLQVIGKLPRNNSLFQARLVPSYAGRDNWEPVCIGKNTTQNEKAGGIK